ncbi:MAG: archaeosortase/exosortase family protein [Kiritimatiellia bacterium]
MRRLTPVLPPLLLLATPWDLWGWFIQRARENEDAALLHLILLIGLGGWWLGGIRKEDGLSRPSTKSLRPKYRAKSPISVKCRAESPTSTRCRTESPTSFHPLSMAGLLLCALLGYIDTYPLIRMTALALTLAATLLMQLPNSRRYALSVTVACLLLPFSEETAAFFLGYPARWLATVGAGFLLTLSGYATEQQGAVLFVNGSPLFADAPCAGLMMGWTGFAAASFIALYHRLAFKRSLLLFVCTGGLVLLGNTLRIAILAQPVYRN